MSQKLYRSHAWLRLRYVVEGKSIDEMAKEAMVTTMTIRRALEANGLITRL